MVVLILLASGSFILNALAEGESFVYDDKGQRDPFVAMVTTAGALVTYDSDLTVGDLILEGVVVDASGKNAAIINGKVVASGDTVGAYKVVSVDAEGVTVIQGDKESVLKLKKGGI